VAKKTSPIKFTLTARARAFDIKMLRPAAQKAMKKFE
jgi:hypothetical protein